MFDFFSTCTFKVHLRYWYFNLSKEWAVYFSFYLSLKCVFDTTKWCYRKYFFNLVYAPYQVSADAHRSAVPDLWARADNQSLQPAAHLRHRHLPRHLQLHPLRRLSEFTCCYLWLWFGFSKTKETGLTLCVSPLLHQVLVVKARHIYRRAVTSNGYLGSQQRASFRVMDRRMLLYPLVFILCWGPGLVLHCFML